MATHRRSRRVVAQRHRRSFAAARAAGFTGPRRRTKMGGMKPSLLLVSLAALLFAPLPSTARAADAAPAPAKAPAAASKTTAKALPKGEVTLKGQLTCAKCGLNESSVCQNVLRVPQPGAKGETKYYLAKNEVAQAHHEEVCGGQVSATVTGRVTEEDGKKVLTASAISLN
jgi:hypothetical protein